MKYYPKFTLVLSQAILWISMMQPSTINSQSIEIQRANPSDNSFYFVHKVRKSETLFSLARTYDLSLKEIEAQNPELNEQQLKEGQEINIPIKTQALGKDSVLGSSPVIYKVMPKDNLFSITRRYFNLTESELLKLNPHITPSLKNGERLVVGYFKKKSPVESLQARESNQLQTEEENTKEAAFEFIPNVAYSRGLALVEANSLGEGRYFALHATAPIESSIAITNPVNERTIYAKVIGRIPPIYEPGVQVVVSSSVARYLGVPDHRFYASIAYQRSK